MFSMNLVILTEEMCAHDSNSKTKCWEERFLLSAAGGGMFGIPISDGTSLISLSGRI